jgi:hypothetical protein
LPDRKNTIAARACLGVAIGELEKALVEFTGEGERDLAILLAIAMGPKARIAEHQGARRVVEIILAALPRIPATGGAA